MGKHSLISTLVALEVTKYIVAPHTIYSRNNMGQKCEGNCGLWVLNEII